MDRKQVIQAIDENKLIVILRGLDRDSALKTAEAMYEGGVRLIEVTFDQSGRMSHAQTAEQISALCSEFGEKLLVGAGTVMSEEQMLIALDAGAHYIISPDSNEAVIRATRKHGLVSIPGAFSPTEAANASRWGADYVKLFPCSDIRPSYIKAISAPLSHIKFLAVGGIDENNLTEYLAAGAVGIGVGASIANKADIAAGDYGAVTRRALKYTQAIRAFTTKN